MALHRKIKQIKEKLRLKMKARKPEVLTAEPSEMPADTTDFVWVGGFQSKPAASTPERTVKRKLSFTSSQAESEEEEEDLPLPLSPATIELQMAWYKNFKIRFFEDEVSSPAKRSRRLSKEKSEQITSTPVHQSYSTIQRELNTFKAFFEPGPDFKIYEDYHYPTFPSPGEVSYRNLLPGNTPAPPLPPRNDGRRPLPPVFRSFKQRDLSPLSPLSPLPPPQALIFRSYRPADLSAAKKTLRFELNFNDRNFGLTKAFSSECLNYSLLL